MADTVFILGAGTSKSAGVPVMNDFMFRAEDLAVLAAKEKDLPYIDAWNLVRRGRTELRAVHSTARIEINNVEDIFSAFEMASVLGRLGDFGGDDIKKLKDAMQTVIVRTVERSLVFLPAVHGGVNVNEVRPPNDHQNFKEVLKVIQGPRCSVAVITFNYDIALDHMLQCMKRPVDYSLGAVKKEETGPRLLKLHGSTNWGYCKTCDVIVPWHLDDFFKTIESCPNVLFAKHRLPNNQMLIPVSEYFSNLIHAECGKRVEGSPVIVPPTWNKSGHHPQLQQVWRQAATELSEAKNIVVIGYSLPLTDQFFRFLYGLGTLGDASIRRFLVYDPNPAIEDRFRQLLGPDVQSRFKFKGATFFEACQLIKSELSAA